MADLYGKILIEQIVFDRFFEITCWDYALDPKALLLNASNQDFDGRTKRILFFGKKFHRREHGMKCFGSVI